MAVTQWWRWW